MIIYEAAAKYYDEHGTVKKIEQGHIIDGGELSSWVANEIKVVNSKDGALRTEEQLEKLAMIGIEPSTIDRHEKQWLMRYEELKAFIDDNKRLPLTRKAKGAENSIAVWLNSQKKKYRAGDLSSKRADMLTKLGVEL